MLACAGWGRYTAAPVGTHERLGLTSIVALGAAFVLAACGGEDRLSREEFQKQGNAICAKYDKQIDAVATPSSIEEVSGYVDKVVPLVEKEISEMKALKPPEEDQESFDRMIAKGEETKEAGEELGAAAEKRDEAAVQRALQKGQAAGNESDRLAGELGLDDCQG